MLLEQAFACFIGLTSRLERASFVPQGLELFFFLLLLLKRSRLLACQDGLKHAGRQATDDAFVARKLKSVCDLVYVFKQTAAHADFDSYKRVSHMVGSFLLGWVKNNATSADILTLASAAWRRRLDGTVSRGRTNLGQP
jgi:hypothetical protein